MDIATISKFDKVPGSDVSFQAEVDLTKKFLGALRHITKKEIIFITGNHEFRLKKYLISIAKELWELDSLALDELLDLNQFNISYVDLDDRYPTFQDNYIEIQDFLVGHFNIARSGLGATSRALIEKYGRSVVQAHVHRIALVAKWQYDKQIVGVEGGCMCKMDNNYRRNANWQRGWTDLVDGEVELHAIL